MSDKDDLSYELLKLQGGRCAGAGRKGGSGRCRARLNQTGFEQEHTVPVALGGHDGRRNKTLFCPRCNREKGKMHPNDYYRSRGLLL
jgi:5-methylcytosine-specific restriction endonuclease McrA